MRRHVWEPAATPGGYDCEVWRTGPYGGVRRYLATLLPERPDLVARHEVELRAAVPEVFGAPEAGPDRIRFHPAQRTRQVAFGIAEFVAAWAEGSPEPAEVGFDNVDLADGTTVELLAALVRRVDPARLRLRLSGAVVPAELAGALGLPSGDGPTDPTDRTGAVRAHEAENGPTAPPAVDGPTDPAALQADLGRCLAAGWYEHAARLALRGRQLVRAGDDPGTWWAFTTGLGTAYAALDRAAEALALYAGARAATDDPKILMSAAYSTAMLHARYLSPDARDATLAREELHTALALAARLDDPRQRTLLTVFYGQGLALLDSRSGRTDAALARIDAGIAALDREFAPDERPQDRARLLHNRAQLHAATGRPDRALADLAAVLARDPDNAEYHVDRAGLHRDLGRPAEALADYTAAIRLGPHPPEAYLHRAALRDDPALALADLGRVLAIDPGHVDALVNRANLRVELGDLDGAETDARAGLALAPREPLLLCTLGLVVSERGDLAGAERLLSRALEHDPDLVAAWTNRAAVRFEAGELDAAAGDLDRAVGLTDDPVVRYNRGLALQGLRRWAEAEADFAAVLADPRVDGDFGAEAREQLAACRAAAP
ncbi:tetratricopeptide repeat protein [Longispora sp. NPDC051575]|uniref:tetratricopeptide repeat protein n=1 Tax=Longispora sp. NPDC051575 TaxID=3154943 RepID=UPI00344838DB